MLRNVAVVAAGKQPGDRERVNPQVVSNWFANKRKEMKKVAREGQCFTRASFIPACVKQVDSNNICHKNSGRACVFQPI